MKIRNGFVSNSSSSSFVIMGTKISDDDYKNICEVYKDEFIKENDIINFNVEDDNYELSELLSEFIDNKLTDKYKLRYISTYWELDTLFVGEVLADHHSDGDVLENLEYNIPDINSKIETFCTDFNIKSNVVIKTGTRCC